MMNKLDTIRAQHPLVICYTNDVVKNFTANGLLSLGASPAMSQAPEEAKDMLTPANALLINIGTLTKDREDDILKIAKIANAVGTPIVFDPVAVGASQYRKEFCKTFLQEVNVSVIKGNASEVLALIDNEATMKGTDSDQDLDAVSIAKKAHEELNCAIVITGKIDVVIQDNQIYKLFNGSPLLAQVTGAGCLLGAIVASFMDDNLKVDIESLIQAVAFYNIAAENAEQLTSDKGPGSFMIALLDSLSQVSEADYLHHCKKQEVE